MKKISEVSKLVGVSKRTLQYYDDEGLLVVERTKNNHRLYDRDDLEQIWKILIYKEMGFELNEIREIAGLSGRQREDYIQKKKAVIEQRIAELHIQSEWIAVVLRLGMPQLPEEIGGFTYTERIQRIREQLKGYAKYQEEAAFTNNTGGKGGER